VVVKSRVFRSFRELLHDIEVDHSRPQRVYDLTWLAEEMLKCYERDLLCWYMVYGATRAGKTTYAVASMAQAARKLGFNPTWGYLSKRIVFDVREILEYFTMARNKRKSGGKDLGVVFDDAGVHLHAYKSFHEKLFVERISSLLQVAGVYTSNIIITTPSPQNVIKMVREMDNMGFILVTRAGEDAAIATIYRVRFYPPRFIRARKLAREEFKLRMPHHDRYMVKRVGYVEQQLAMLKAYLESLEDSQLLELTQPEEPELEIVEEQPQAFEE
jgi:hypothetical protein